MTKKELQKIERESAREKDFIAVSNVERGKTPVTAPSNVKQVSATATVEAPLSLQGEKSATVRFLKSEHLSLSQTLKTVRENFESPQVRRFIELLKAQPTELGKKRFPVILSVEDFSVPNVMMLYPFVTDESGKKVLCRFRKVTEKNANKVAVSFGTFSGLNGTIIESEKETTAVFELNSEKYGLFKIEFFTVWDIFTRVIKAKKDGTFIALKEKREKEKAEKAEAKAEAEKAEAKAKAEAEKAEAKAKAEAEKAATEKAEKAA